MEDKPDNGFPIMYLSTMALSVSFCLYPVTKTVKEMSVARFAAEKVTILILLFLTIASRQNQIRIEGSDSFD